MSKFDASKLQIRPLAPRISSKHPKRDLWIAAAAATAAAALLYLVVSSRSATAPRFGIIIDAGSTGTRIHVFCYAADNDPRATTVPTVDLESTGLMKVSPGLSSYINNPDRAGESLVELLKFGRRRVPRDRLGDTEIRLMATAGMRLVDSLARDAILESCRRILRSSGFQFRDEWASVIPGADEGIYAWIAANYALGTLGGDPHKTTGIIELGGASAQVAFVSSEPVPLEFSNTIKFGETTYNVYSNSLLHFGQNVAHASLHQLLNSGDLNSSTETVQKGTFIDPCSPKGYSGNFSECRSAALKVLEKEKGKCMYQQCYLGSTFVPKLQGRFLATENFFYTTKFFDLGPTPILSDLMLAGRQFCEGNWLELRRKHHTLDEQDFSRYCFSSAYIIALLHDSLGIALDDKRIEFANQVGGIELEWALGAFIMRVSSEPSAIDSGWITALTHNNSTSLVALSIFSSLLVFIVWSVSRWRKPQVKTIYDLEKGRYIVTRANL